MIRFWYYPYTLNPALSLSSLANDRPRQGALFKMRWPDEKIGFADVHPWPELGDNTIEKQIQWLSKGKLTQLMEQAIWLARADAMARSSNRNLLAGIEKVKNHFLVTDYKLLTEKSLSDLQKSGFSTLKLKFGRNFKDEALWLSKLLQNHPFRVRLDYNSKGNLEGFAQMANLLGPQLLSRIEFIEDALPWDNLVWQHLAKSYTLALDQEEPQVEWSRLKWVPFKVLVIKPARQDVPKSLSHANKFKLNTVVTSSLDHPVGVAHAARIASELKQTKPLSCLESGILSYKVYKPDVFSLSMLSRGPHLLPIKGTGIGFDHLLNNLQWQPVKML
jgi:O-succinylbenzoate synthase